MPTSYSLVPEAGQDLRAIWFYTVTRWGEEQADRYLGLLEHCFERLAEHKTQGKTFSSLYPHVRIMRCEHHYIFYLSSHGTPLIILAVLHERMDLLSRMRARLEA